MAPVTVSHLKHDTFRRKCHVFILTTITIVSLVAAFTFGDVESYKSGMKAVDLSLVLKVTGLVFFCNLCRALRLRAIVDGLGGLELLQSTFLHQLAAQSLPAKAGEAVLPLLLANRTGLTFMHSVGVLIFIRGLDVIVLLLLCTLAIVVAGDTSSSVLIGATLGLVALSGAIAIGLPIARRVHEYGMGSNISIVRSALRVAEPVAKISLGQYSMVLATSCALWVVNLLAFMVAFNVLDRSVNAVSIVIGATASNLVSALPVQGLGGFGPSQLSLAGVIQYYGHDFETALVAGMVVQFAALISSAAGLLIFFAAQGSMCIYKRGKGDV